MVQFTAPVVALLAAATAVSAHWRDAHSANTTEIHMTGTHLGGHLARRDATADYLKAHNDERAKHGAKALVWDSSLAASAQAWANQCKFQHSQSGQNLAAGTGNPSIATAIGWWNAERADYKGPDDYSHWTQVVWKSTTKLGCALKQCAPGTIFDASYGVANYYVCHYNPVGNVLGQFPQNVQP
ncbi:hypothetical protein FRC07_014768 [Ceratobasidium sp. 392]|nr:hypothetical protein FRC07_014768 [Ceratobasidium sp. 392]